MIPDSIIGKTVGFYPSGGSIKFTAVVTAVTDDRLTLSNLTAIDPAYNTWLSNQVTNTVWDASTSVEGLSTSGYSLGIPVSIGTMSDKTLYLKIWIDVSVEYKCLQSGLTGFIPVSVPMKLSLVSYVVWGDTTNIVTLISDFVLPENPYTGYFEVGPFQNYGYGVETMQVYMFIDGTICPPRTGVRYTLNSSGHMELCDCRWNPLPEKCINLRGFNKYDPYSNDYGDVSWDFVVLDL
jgi:hypothetical protein